MSEVLNTILSTGVPLDIIEKIKERCGASNEDIAAAIIAMQERGETVTAASFGIIDPEDERPSLTEYNGSFLSLFKTLDSFEEEEATWLVPGWIPEGQITMLASDGGVGKTSLWCNIIAAISSGKPCVLDPEGHTREPQKVAFLTTEDSVKKTLRKKLREADANIENIVTLDISQDKSGEMLKKLKFGNEEIGEFIKHFKPVLCVFDPIQGFISSKTNMGARNEMRDCMASLLSLGEETGTTFLVVAHSNKRKGASGRDRIADSADLWDISRSVLMAGYTEEQGVRYLSQEKSNYGKLQETLLFTINDSGQIMPQGRTWKRDREYVQDAAYNVSAPKREDCKAWILSELNSAGGTIPSKELEDRAKACGYSNRTLERAKKELKDNSDISYVSKGRGKEKVWYIERHYQQEFIDMPNGTPIPWED